MQLELYYVKPKNIDDGGLQCFTNFKRFVSFTENHNKNV